MSHRFIQKIHLTLSSPLPNKITIQQNHHQQIAL